jgi:hypothetical protein
MEVIMKSKSITLAKNARHLKWIQEVQDCKNRPEGMSVVQWCNLHGIKYSTYYQHYLKVKDLCVEQMEAQLKTVATTNAVIPLVAAEPAFVELKPLLDSASEPIFISCGKAKIELHEDISESFLIKLFGALSHVE